VACARLIGDIAIITVETSGPALAQDLQQAGINAHWVRPPATADMQTGEVAIELYTTRRSPSRAGTMQIDTRLQTRRYELERYLIELINQRTWIDSLNELLSKPHLLGRPWPYFRDEHKVWV
jgi:hypothetical protein